MRSAAAVPATQLAFAGRIRPGDGVLIGGRVVAVARVKRAQGRKPAVGENLHLVTEDGDTIRINSTAVVRIRRSADPS
jgi:hypothetical protein